MISAEIEFMLRYFDTPLILCKNIDGTNHLMIAPKNHDQGEKNESVWGPFRD